MFSEKHKLYYDRDLIMTYYTKNLMHSLGSSPVMHIVYQDLTRYMSFFVVLEVVNPDQISKSKVRS